MASRTESRWLDRAASTCSRPSPPTPTTNGGSFKIRRSRRSASRSGKSSTPCAARRSKGRGRTIVKSPGSSCGARRRSFSSAATPQLEQPEWERLGASTLGGVAGGFACRLRGRSSSRRRRNRNRRSLPFEGPRGGRLGRGSPVGPQVLEVDVELAGRPEPRGSGPDRGRRRRRSAGRSSGRAAARRRSAPAASRPRTRSAGRRRTAIRAAARPRVPTPGRRRRRSGAPETFRPNPRRRGFGRLARRLGYDQDFAQLRRLGWCGPRRIPPRSNPGPEAGGESEPPDVPHQSVPDQTIRCRLHDRTFLVKLQARV